MLTFGTINSYSQSCHGGGGGGGMDMGGMNHSQHKDTPEQVQPTVQTICPIMGNQVDRTIFTDWEGDENNTPKRVYFCCPMCVDKFKAKPTKYIKKLRKMNQPIENIVQQKPTQQ